MGIFQQFPYSNFHEMNLDEVLKEIKKLVAEWASYHTQWDAWQLDIQHSIDDLYAMFDNLNIPEEVRAAIDEMAADGRLIAIIAPYMPWVTPEMFGAVGDGVTNDTQAFIDAFNSNRPIYCADGTYAVDTIDITTSGYMTGQNYKIRAIGSDDWNTIFNASDIDFLIIENAEIEGNGLPLSTDVYHTVFKMTNVKNFTLRNSYVHGFYNRTPEIVGTVDERTAVIFTVVDYEYFNVNNCKFSDLVGGEFTYVSCTTKEKSDAAILNFTNNKIFDITDIGVIKANSFNFFGGVVNVNDNIIDNYKTDYTYFNMSGVTVNCINNTITNGAASDIFDTYEAGYLYSDIMNVENNNIECKNANMVRFRGQTLNIKNNYFKGKAALFGSGCYRSADDIFLFSTRFPFGNASINVTNNNLELAYVDDGIQHVAPFIPWGAGSYSALLDGGIAENITIINNTVNMSAKPAGITPASRSAFVETWNNYDNLTVDNNVLVDPVRTSLSSTNYFWIATEATFDRTVKKISLQNNVMKDTTLGSMSMYFKKTAGIDASTPVLNYGIDLGNVDNNGSIASNIYNGSGGDIMPISNFLTMRTSTVTGVVNHYCIPLLP